MVNWNKIDWFCPGCAEYWMTTENCHPACDLRCDCECEEAATSTALAKCHTCGFDLQTGQDLCYHFANRSQAV